MANDSISHSLHRDVMAENLEQVTIINHKWDRVSLAFLEKRARVSAYVIYVSRDRDTGELSPNRWTAKTPLENITILQGFREDLLDSNRLHDVAMREWNGAYEKMRRDVDWQFKQEYYGKVSTEVSAWREANPPPTAPDYS